MSANLLATKTLNYIWHHPNSQEHKLQSISKFIGWQFYKRVTNKAVDIELVDNVKLRCHPDSYSAASVLYCGLYDYNEMNFLLRYLRPSDSFLDIGANIGVYTILAASKIKQGSIHSFEVLPKNYQRLLENIELNHFSQIKPYQIAISDRPGKVSLNLVDGDSMAFISENSAEKSFSVEANTIDNLLATENTDSLTLAKIDIEGAELLALKGASKLLKSKRPKVWIMEINSTISNFSHGKDDVVSLLKASEYSLYKYDAKQNCLYSIEIENHYDNNVLAIADSELHFVMQRLDSE